MESWTRLPGPRGWLPVSFSTWNSMLSHMGRFSRQHDGFLAAGWFRDELACWHAMALSTPALMFRFEHCWSIQVAGEINSFLSLCFLESRWWLFSWYPLSLWTGGGQPSLGRLGYPEWIESYPSFTQRPVWVELSTYVGIIGGSSYDYLCYVSFLREKGWGRAGFDAWEINPRGAVSRAKVSPQVSASDVADARPHLDGIRA